MNNCPGCGLNIGDDQALCIRCDLSMSEMVPSNENPAIDTCPHESWNVIAEIGQITGAPDDIKYAIGQFIVRFKISCDGCGLLLRAIDDGKVVPFLETVMFR